jgi:organic hydroperoxide reductase OsmC/OhrA
MLYNNDTITSYSAKTSWDRGEHTFTDGRYSRAHTWRFNGGIEVPASSSPHVVPLPMSMESAIDPEEAFVAALSSCHMLCFFPWLEQRDSWWTDMTIMQWGS